MSPAELLWYVPLMAAIAFVLGVTSTHGTSQVLRETRARFVGLTLMVLLVGLVMRVLVVLFA